MKKILGIAAVLAVTLVAGCGSSDSSDEGSTSSFSSEDVPETLSKAEVIEQGDEICSEVNRKVDELDSEFQAASDDGDLEKAADIFGEQLDLSIAAQEDFSELMSDEDQDVLDQINDLRDQSFSVAPLLEDAIREGEYSKIENYSDDFESNTDTIRGLSQGFGFDECGSGTD